jgi:hypothetical protein
MADPWEGLSRRAKAFVVVSALALTTVLGAGLLAAFSIDLGQISTTVRVILFCALIIGLNCFWYFVILPAIKQAGRTPLNRQTIATKTAVARLRKRDPNWPTTDDDH